MLRRRMNGHDVHPSLRLTDVRRRFDRAASGFGDSDFVHRQCFDGLLDRLAPMALDPRRILDLGCGSGAGSRRLAKAYRRARISGLDLSAGMLEAGRGARSRFSRIAEVQGDARQLPFAPGVFDLIVANLLLPWLADPADALAEVARTLRREGLFLFASLGPDSLIEIRRAWQPDDGHVHPFIDMHDLGDALVRAGLRDPVLDVERLTVTYRSAEALFADLTATGARNALDARRPSLTGRRRFRRFTERLLAERSADGVFAVTLELVFGHAWGGGPPQSPGEFRVAPGTIGRRRR